VREEAATTLGKLGLHQAEDQLIATLQDSYWQVRLRAARSLGRLRSAAALQALIDTLSHESSNLRKEAALASVKSGKPLPFPRWNRCSTTRIPRSAKQRGWPSNRFAPQGNNGKRYALSEEHKQRRGARGDGSRME
jgi:hypothetical protein